LQVTGESEQTWTWICCENKLC